MGGFSNALGALSEDAETANTSQKALGVLALSVRQDW